MTAKFRVSSFGLRVLTLMGLPVAGAANAADYPQSTPGA